MRDTARLRAFLAHLDRLDDEDRHDATVSEMMETDGFFYNRGKGRPWVVRWRGSTDRWG